MCLSQQRPLVEFALEAPAEGVASEPSPNEHESAESVAPARKASGLPTQQQGFADSGRASGAVGQLEELSSTVYDSVRRQIEQQLGGESEFGRRIEKELSDFFGEPVKIRATIDNSSSVGVGAQSKEAPTQSSQAISGPTKLQRAAKQINGPDSVLEARARASNRDGFQQALRQGQMRR